MSSALVNLALDVLIVVMLAATIFYCWLLNRRIKVLQDSKSELAQLLKHFDESTQRASESIIALQTASKKIGENIQFRIDKANFLLDDLQFMIERGSKLTHQLEAGFAVGRARTRTMTETGGEAPRAAEKPARPPERLPEKMPEPVAPLHASAREKTAASLEAVLERVRHHKAAMAEHAEPERPPAPRPPQGRVRSKAEQELLDLIKAGIKG